MVTLFVSVQLGEAVLVSTRVNVVVLVGLKVGLAIVELKPAGDELH
jgi:hypothetical protein